MWKIDREEDFFRIYDSNKDIAGYFDPDYGEIFPKEKEIEIIEEMHKNHDKIQGGHMMVPMVKFGIFNADAEMNIGYLQNHLNASVEIISRWADYISKSKNYTHYIRISHTDQDMLSITFPIKFSNAVPLEKKILLQEIEPILDLLHKQGLL